MLGQEGAPPIKDALQSYVKQDLQSILQDYNLEKLEYYGEDGFFHLDEDYKSEAIYPILQFYKNLDVSPIHEKLAELPFHFIFSLSPDDLIQRAMEANGLAATFHYYDKRRYNKEEDDAILNFKPTLENRLVYNVFGSIHNEGSLILSYDDLFEFLQRVFNNYHLPVAVRETIREANCFVFVGFSYSKWYLKLLLRLLNLQEKVKTVYGMDTPERPELETFFVNEFDVNFTKMNTRQFIHDLHAACAEAGLLITASKDKGSKQMLPVEIVNQVEALVRQNDLKAGLALLHQHCETGTAPPDCCRQQVQLAARLNALQKDNHKGIVDYRDYHLQYNIIINDLLELIQTYR